MFVFLFTSFVGIENIGSNQKENIFHVLLRLNFLSSEKCVREGISGRNVIWMLPTSGSGVLVTEVW